MSRFKLHILCVSVFVLALVSAGNLPARSDSAPRANPQPQFNSFYRSKTSAHKVIVYAGEQQLRDRLLAEGGSVIADYGAFALLDAPGQAAEMLSVASAAGSAVRDDMNVIFLRAGAFDTTEGELPTVNALARPDPAVEQLYLVQMVGPAKREWIDQLAEAAEIINYIPNNAFLVRASESNLNRINRLAVANGGFVQWSGAYKPAYKIAPEISLDSDREITVTVQLVKDLQPDTQMQNLAVRTLSGRVVGEPVDVLKYRNVRMNVRTSELAQIARGSDVVWIEEWHAPVLHDERQGLIVAGKHSGNVLDPPGYLAWLQSKGLASTPDFIVDVSDSGMDRGVLDPEVLHPDFLNVAGVARVVYARYVEGSEESDSPINDTTGHGTINASIIGGYNTGTAFPYVDSVGYSYGLGIHPFVKLGSTKIFAPSYTNPSLASMVDGMYRNGARISSNSWGAANNAYSLDSQLYDVLVRDARSSVSGNQEMTIVFSSGNQGPNGHLSSPGTAKNVITVGASQNFRPTATDGCQIPSSGASDVNSVISFSSGGPATDGRVKPEIVAPGTHIQGAQSQDPAFNAGGVCGPKDFPPGQSLYTWSSGTSHSAPAVAGAAALIRQYFQETTSRPASPAMIKAFLTNSTDYLTGTLAGDNLPGNSQGWGLLNIGRALDGVSRMSVDEDQMLKATGEEFTLSGFVADPTKPFRVTLAWSDAPGSPAGNPVVNDLDLRVEIGGKTYLGNNFAGTISVESGVADKLNNVESVWLPEGVTGEFTIHVVAATIAGDGVPGNGDATDQDFALVAYNAQPQDDGGGDGGGGGGSTDDPPTVKLSYPQGGERLMVGDLVRILWDASDDKEIQSQRVEFSSDNGVTYNTIAVLNGTARTFDWKIPSFPTPFGRIKVTALDGVNLPVSSVSANPFEIVNGPPDTSPPDVLLLSPNTDTVLGGGTVATIKWTENDNVGVVQRVIELSTDNGTTFQRIISLIAPSSGEQQSYDWQVPAPLDTTKGKVRITLYDGAGNSATVTSAGKFEVWPLPIITEVDFDPEGGKKGQLQVFGRNFRMNQTNIYVDGQKMKKLVFNEKCDSSTNICKRISSNDKKMNKRVPEGKFVNVIVVVPKTGQTTPEFSYKRKKPKSS